MHGKDITIPKGTEITAYINGDIPLDPAKCAAQPPSRQDVSATASRPPAGEPVQSGNGVDTALATIEVKSTPDGAEITVDGKYMGSTPSALRLSAGDHSVKLEKPGFKTWEKTLTVSSGGTAMVNATLETQQSGEHFPFAPHASPATCSLIHKPSHMLGDCRL